MANMLTSFVEKRVVQKAAEGKEKEKEKVVKKIPYIFVRINLCVFSRRKAENSLLHDIAR